MADAQPLISIEPLAAHHDRSDFSCGIEALNRYLRHQASQDARKNVATAFVLVETGSVFVRGFYTLSAISVALQDLSEKLVKSLPKYPHVPAILLGRLAVDQRSRGKGYGELLLVDAFTRCLATSEIGWAAMVVDAKDEDAASFYEHFEFIRMSPDSNRLFLPRTTIASLMK